MTVQLFRRVLLIWSIMLEVILARFVHAEGYNSFSNDTTDNSTRRRLARGVDSFIVDHDCQWNGTPICCGLVKESMPDSLTYPRQIIAASPDLHCSVKKHYVPSPYETMHIEKMIEWEKNPPLNSTAAFLDFIEEDIVHANVWVRRVKDHMSAADIEPNADDYKYMSYFNFTRTCHLRGKEVKVASWVEWIEPITVHARNPFGILSCSRVPKGNHKVEPALPLVHPQNVDYIILKPASKMMERVRLVNHGGPVIPRHYFFDAGTAHFGSGLAWFLCSYLKVC